MPSELVLIGASSVLRGAPEGGTAAPSRSDSTTCDGNAAHAHGPGKAFGTDQANVVTVSICARHTLFHIYLPSFIIAMPSRAVTAALPTTSLYTYLEPLCTCLRVNAKREFGPNTTLASGCRIAAGLPMSPHQPVMGNGYPRTSCALLEATCSAMPAARRELLSINHCSKHNRKVCPT